MALRYGTVALTTRPSRSRRSTLTHPLRLPARACRAAWEPCGEECRGWCADCAVARSRQAVLAAASAAHVHAVGASGRAPVHSSSCRYTTSTSSSRTEDHLCGCGAGQRCGSLGRHRQSADGGKLGGGGESVRTPHRSSCCYLIFCIFYDISAFVMTPTSFWNADLSWPARLCPAMQAASQKSV